MTQALPQLAFPKKVNAYLSHERVLEKKKWICEEIEIWLVKKTFWKSLQKQICPTLDGLKIKIWEHAFLLSYIFQNPIPNNFTG